MKTLKKFAEEFNRINNEKILPGDSISENIEFLRQTLTGNEFYPSVELKNYLNRLSIRAKEPMKVAVTGHFSSGKSTFLNALLSEDILPTGITPVTSKVNFIKYANESKLEITFADDRVEFHTLENLKKFTDQRNGTNDIKYLTIYLPLDILKKITFVDTPGLNSQSIEDTSTTVNILKEVDGVIWVTLMDNAGKFSEELILKEFLKNSHIKSLCVLNQKDRFEENEVDKTVNYIQKTFKSFFDKVIPISAKQALLSRKNSKNILLNEKIKLFTKNIQEKLRSNIPENISFFKNDYDTFKQEVKEIISSDTTNQKKLLEKSNIAGVINFIEKEIAPSSNTAKEKSLKDDMHKVCDILTSQYQTLKEGNQKLIDILEGYEKNIEIYCQDLKENYTDSLKLNHERINNIINIIANEIYNNINKIKKHRYIKNKSKIPFISRVEQIEYEMPWFNSEEIYKNLFYNDNKIEKMIKKVLRDLKEIEEKTKDDIFRVYNTLEEEIKSWQNIYTLITKNEDISSDREFADFRRFASKAFENILKDFLLTNLKLSSKIDQEFGYIRGALEFNYQNATKTTVALFKRRIFESITYYEEDPQSYAIYNPLKSDIENQVKIHFSQEKIETLIKSNRNFLNKNIELLKEDFKSIAFKKIENLKSKQDIFNKKIENLKNLKNSF